MRQIVIGYVFSLFKGLDYIQLLTHRECKNTKKDNIKIMTKSMTIIVSNNRRQH